MRWRRAAAPAVQGGVRILRERAGRCKGVAWAVTIEVRGAWPLWAPGAGTRPSYPTSNDRGTGSLALVVALVGRATPTASDASMRCMAPGARKAGGHKARYLACEHDRGTRSGPSCVAGGMRKPRSTSSRSGTRYLACGVAGRGAQAPGSQRQRLRLCVPSLSWGRRGMGARPKYLEHVRVTR